MKSIQSKILLVVILGLLVMTAVLSVISVGMTHEVMHTDADRILNNMCQKEAAYLNDMLGDISKSTLIMKHYASSELESVDKLGDAAYREQYLAKMKIMFEEVARNTDGVKAFHLRLNPACSTPMSGCHLGRTDSGDFEPLPLTDLSKYSAADKAYVGWYYDAVAAGKGIWTDPYIKGNTTKRLISFAVPFYCDGALAGVIGMDVDFGYFVQYVNSIEVYTNGYSVLYGKDGETVYNETEDFPIHEESTKPHTNAVTELDNGMKLALFADYKDIQRNIYPVLFKIVAAAVVVMFVFILYAVLMTRKIVAPIKKLTEAAQNIADGKTTVEVAIDSKDEIGMLATVLSTTYEKLMEYTKYINTLAYRDSLTGIKNHTAYTEAAAKMDEKIRHGHPAFGVLVADINNLKNTNDYYGHDIGNELIIHTARTLCGTFKSSPVFRIGGDEFVVILHGKDLDTYRELLVEMDAMCEEDYIAVNDERIPVSIARGVAVYDVHIDKIFDDVFNKADRAMYLHKQSQKAALV